MNTWQPRAAECVVCVLRRGCVCGVSVVCLAVFWTAGWWFRYKTSTAGLCNRHMSHTHGASLNAP